jgi:hypothetical protein
MKSVTAAPTAAPRLPFSWPLKNWPLDVFPFNGVRARRVLRDNQEQLEKANAIGRYGHELIVFGAGYAEWLQAHAAQVNASYVVSANRPEHAHKRFGRGGASVKVTAEEISEVMTKKKKR